MEVPARYRSAAIVVVLSVALAGLTTLLEARSRAAAEEEAARTQAEVVAASLVAHVATGSALVDSLGGLLDASEQVTPATFAAFASHSLVTFPEFPVLRYAEVVLSRDRPAFEQALAARGHPGGIRIPTEGGPAPAPDRDRYMAVVMQAPSAGNEDVYGLDISHRPANEQLIDAVAALGVPQVGAWERIEATGEPSLQIYAPVYAKGAQPATPAERTSSLVGIAGTVFLYEAALRALPADPDVEYAVLAPGAGEAGEPLVLYSSSGSVQDPADALAWPVARTSTARGLDLVVAARTLPTASSAGLPPWLAGLLVLALGLALAAYVARTAESRRLARVTEQLQIANERLRYLTDHDDLTGLLGRDAARRVLDRWMAAPAGQSRVVCAMLIDVDRFGLVNSTWGHDVGDEVIRQLADRLQAFVDDSTLIARLGGDEFLMLRTAPDVDALRLKATTRGVQRVLAEPVTVGQLRQSFTTSIGLALFPMDASDADQLLAKADAAVRSAQSIGSGQVVLFNPTVEAVEAERIEIEREVSIALREPDIPFHMVYQPQVRMTDGRCVGLEALVRWPAHPAGPGVFIPVAERSGLIVPLGRHVARAVVRQLRAWNRAGVDVPIVSFNVSADQFLEDFATRLLRLLEEEGVEPRQLEVEVTEYSALREAAQVQLAKLRRNGVRVAIDDFGTGFSSLARLSSMPVDRLKIDRSFIVGLPGEPGAVEVVRTIAELSRGLGLDVVCEGVQTDAQATMLLELGLDIAQGFRYARPMPAGQVPPYLRSASPVLTTD